MTLRAERPCVRALGVEGSLIRVIGEDGDVLAHAGSQTRVVDAAGALVVPGLTDGHAHLDREGLRSVFADMSGLRTVGAVLDRIAELVRDAPQGHWVVTMPLGEPPYYEGDHPYPTREQLDAVSGSTPVFIRPIWGYWRHLLPLASVMNTAALERLGADKLALAEQWATVHRDRRGAPTGLIEEHTYEPTLEFLLPDGAGRFDAEMRREGIREGMTTYASTGTTSIFEGHGVAEDVADAYRDLNDHAQLSLRARLPLSLPWADLDDAERDVLWQGVVASASSRGARGDMLRFSGLSLGSEQSPPGASVRRAARPYTGWAGFEAGSWLPQEELVEELVRCARQRVQVAAMTPDMLKVYQQVDRIVPLRGLRWVIGHVNILTPRDIAEIARMGLVVTTHTNRYLYKEGEKGQERAEQEGGAPVPLRSLLDAGVPVSLGTDNVPTSLFGPIAHAVSRRTREGRVVGSEERITRMEALQAAAIGGAMLSFDEGWRGILAVGWTADLVMLTDDLLSVPEEQIAQIEAQLTVVNGRIVYQR